MRRRYPTKFVVLCFWCKKNSVLIDGPKRAWEYRKYGRAYCSHECGAAYTRTRAKPMAEKVRRMHSRRMRKHNPMTSPETRAKMRTTLRAMGWGPTVRGGNGQGPTVPQMLLASALGWPMEVPVSLGPKRRGYPTCYKLDIAEPTLKVGIEIDGSTHRSRKHLDDKKDAALLRRGWAILRFSNKEVTETLQECIKVVLALIAVRGLTGSETVVRSET